MTCGVSFLANRLMPKRQIAVADAGIYASGCRLFRKKGFTLLNYIE